MPALVGAVLGPLSRALAQHLPLLRDPPLLSSLVEGLLGSKARHGGLSVPQPMEDLS